MKNLIIILALMNISSSCASEKENSLLWEISGQDLKQPSYLLGTHHGVCYTFLDSIPRLHEAFNSVDQLVCEIIAEDQVKYIQQSSYMPENVNYEDLFTPSDLEVLNNKLIRVFKEDTVGLKKLKPSVLQFVYQSRRFQQLAITNVEGVPIAQCTESMDKHIGRVAKEQKYKLVGLDDESDAFFNRESIERQAEMLMCYLEIDTVLDVKGVSESLTEFGKSFESAYRNFDLTKMEEIISEIHSIQTEHEYPNPKCRPTQVEIDGMGKTRNLKWVKKLPAILKESPSFIAVGAAHLIGDSGLIDQLRELGYKVEPVK